MCLNKIFSSPDPVALPAPPPVQPMQQTQTSLPEKRPLVDKDEVAKVEYGAGAKKASPGAGKKRGAGQLRIPLNTGASLGSQSGGANV